MISGNTGSQVMEPHGTFLLGAGWGPIAFGSVATVTPMPIPPLAILMGIDIHLQSLAVPPGNPFGQGVFSNRISATIW